ncbi:hypothetical protein K440DRAFT_56264 [Wilcoxina mikolae CBS 423.85]|nr:hypothetical protein K440DRAFT_56264 [Wilcoxina mikolae CBS 423.85]
MCQCAFFLYTGSSGGCSKSESDWKTLNTVNDWIEKTIGQTLLSSPSMDFGSRSRRPHGLPICLEERSENWWDVAKYLPSCRVAHVQDNFLLHRELYLAEIGAWHMRQCAAEKKVALGDSYVREAVSGRRQLCKRKRGGGVIVFLALLACLHAQILLLYDMHPTTNCIQPTYVHFMMGIRIFWPCGEVFQLLLFAEIDRPRGRWGEKRDVVISMDETSNDIPTIPLEEHKTTWMAVTYVHASQTPGTFLEIFFSFSRNVGISWSISSSSWGMLKSLLSSSFSPPRFSAPKANLRACMATSRFLDGRHRKK